MNNEYFSDEEVSASDSDSDFLAFSDTVDNESTAGKSRDAQFSVQYKNKQIETLKTLRSCLKENKILKKRLVIVENELEKYQDYRTPDILPLRDKSTSTMENQPVQPVQSRAIEIFSPDENDMPLKIDVFKSFAEKAVQVNFEPSPVPQLPQSSSNTSHSPHPLTSEVRVVKEVVKEIQEVVKEVFIETKQSPKALLDEACQTIDDVTDKLKIADLNRQIDLMNKKFSEDLEEWMKKTTESEKEVTELKTALSLANRSLDVVNERLIEANKKILKLTDENQKIDSMRQNETMLKVENSQLVRDLDVKQKLLDEANVKFDELNENQRKSLELIESQKRLMRKLEEDVENQSALANSRLEGLQAEIHELKANLNREIAENGRLNDLITELNKHIERYKQDLKNFNFKEFVAMKRELNSLRQEKERQFVNEAANGQVQAMPAQNTPPLPPIKPTKNNIFNFFK